MYDYPTWSGSLLMRSLVKISLGLVFVFNLNAQIVNGPGGGSGGASGTVTVVGGANLTSTALTTGGGSQTIQTPSTTTTLDSNGNILTPGNVSSGVGSGVAGSFMSGAGSAPTLPGNSFGWGAPATMTTTVELVSPNAVPTANQIMLFPAPTSNVSQFSWASVAVISGTLDQTGVSTANSGTPQNVLASTPQAGHYRLLYYVDQSAGCATLGSGALTISAGWTDATHARATTNQTLTVATADTGTGDYLTQVVDFWASASSAVTVTATYTACGSGTWTYDLHAYVERIK